MPKFAATLALSLVGVPSGLAAAMSAAADDVCLAEGACAASSGGRPGQENLLLQVVGTPGRSKHGLLQAEDPIAYRTSGEVSGDGQWCKASGPAADWTLRKCSAATGQQLEVKVLTYNLYWWNLFGPQFRNGNGGSAGSLIASGGADVPFDFMGFQECEDVGRVLRDAGLDASYGTVVGNHAVAMAYRKSAWELLGQGMDEVAEDRPEQWYGTRGALWGRFRHTSSGKTVTFVNHHGPLPVGTGGKCGRHATAWNLLKTVATHAEDGDGVVLLGDFNSDASTLTVSEVEKRLNRVYTGTSFGGVDHVFSNCGNAEVVERRNLGGGGSDHDALFVRIRL